MSYPQAATDMRFWSKEGCGGSGGAVSETASYANTNNGVEPPLKQQRFDSIPTLRGRNAKTVKSTNIIASNDGIINKKVPQGSPRQHQELIIEEFYCLGETSPATGRLQREILSHECCKNLCRKQATWNLDHDSKERV